MSNQDAVELSPQVGLLVTDALGVIAQGCGIIGVTAEQTGEGPQIAKAMRGAADMSAKGDSLQARIIAATLRAIAREVENVTEADVQPRIITP